MLKVIDYNDIPAAKWDAFIETNRSGWFYHTSAFLKAWSFVGPNVSFAILNDDEIVAVFVCNRYFVRTKKPVSLFGRIKKHLGLPYEHKVWSYLNSDGGVVVADGLGKKLANKVHVIFRETIENIMEESNDRRLTASLPVLPWLAAGGNPLCEWGFINKDIQSVVVNLREPWGLDKCSETTRQEVRKVCAMECISFREACASERDLDQYYRLHCETYNRTGAIPFDKSCFAEFFQAIMPAGRCRILFAQKGGEVIASNITIKYKGLYYYWANASSSQVENDKVLQGVNKTLLFKQIEMAREEGGLMFDVGGVLPYAQKGKLAGLTRFKSSLGGERRAYYKGVYAFRNQEFNDVP